jgi:hypothetical protein
MTAGDIDLLPLLSQGGAQSVLLVIVAWFLKSSVSLLTKIYSSFMSIDLKLGNIVTQNDKIITQNDTMNEKLINIQVAQNYSLDSAKKI